MNDPLIARFADACGAVGPLNLRVGLAEGGVLAEGTVHQPFTLVGRDDACDVTLNDPDVHPRHAWFQVIDGGVYAVDLGSRAGLVWPTGEAGPGWLAPGSVVRVGPFRVALQGTPPDRPAPHPNPLQSDPSLARSRPVVQLEFRNGKRPKDRWTVNRVLTLVGRSETCKLHLSADDISSYHCGLVLTPAGLWVVDLSGRGVVVNGERMRVAPLTHGSELWVGRFLIGCRYPTATDPPPADRPAPTPAEPPQEATAPSPAAVSPLLIGPPTAVMSISPLAAEDEVPLGKLPAIDSATGLPSSHILCGTFRPPAGSGPISAPIMLGGSGPISPPSATRRPTARIPVRPAEPAVILKSPPPAPAPVPVAKPAEPPPPVPAPQPLPADSPAAPLLQHLADIHAQMFEQIQQSLLMMAQLCGQARLGQTAAVQQELARIKELNGELARMQAEATRLALAEAAGPDAARIGQPDPARTSAHVPSATRVETPDADVAIRDWMQQQLSMIQSERQARWQKLVGLFADGDAAG